MSTIKERILQIIEGKHLSPHAFEVKCGLTNGYVKNINEEIGSKKMESILKTFPEISAEWLLLGEGEMLKKNDTSSFHSQRFENINQVASNIVTIPTEISSALIHQLEVKDSQIGHLQGQNSSLTSMLQYTLSSAKLQEPRT